MLGLGRAGDDVGNRVLRRVERGQLERQVDGVRGTDQADDRDRPYAVGRHVDLGRRGHRQLAVGELGRVAAQLTGAVFVLTVRLPLRVNEYQVPEVNLAGSPVMVVPVKSAIG